MSITRGNAAIVNHIQDRKELHLFKLAKKGWYQYIGEMICVGYEWKTGLDKNKKTRRIIVFKLEPIESYQEGAVPPEIESDIKKIEAETDLTILRKKAMEYSVSGQVGSRTQRQQVWIRNEAIKQYALRRADGVCEGCGNPAPFITLDGKQYLEAHHIKRLSDGGPDHPE